MSEFTPEKFNDGHILIEDYSSFAAALAGARQLAKADLTVASVGTLDADNLNRYGRRLAAKQARKVK